jgi:hypothetical protein
MTTRLSNRRENFLRGDADHFPATLRQLLQPLKNYSAQEIIRWKSWPHGFGAMRKIFAAAARRGDSCDHYHPNDECV